MVHVTVRVLDEAGHLVPTADNEVAFQIEGQGRLVGVDNGNPASHEPFQADRRGAFNGLCLAIVQASTVSGQIRITASATGLHSDSATITTTRG